MKYLNNPCNVRVSSARWLGSVESKRGFCQFKSLKYGVRVVLYLLLKTYPRYGCKTVESCIKRFCPFGDGNNNPAAYIDYVCYDGRLRPLSVVCDLSDDDLFCLVRRMCWIESNTFLSREDFDEAKILL